MNTPGHQQQLVTTFQNCLASGTFVSLTLGNYKGQEETLKNIYLKRVRIKNQDKLSLTYRYKTRDIVKNYALTEGPGLIDQYLESGFYNASLFTTEADFFLDILPNRKTRFQKKEPSKKEIPALHHDHIKQRLITTNSKSYLTDLRITDADGKVFKNAQDKYRQINHYIELLSSLIRELPAWDKIKVVDMGSGKGYLTFALYDYLKNILRQDAEVTGVEFREDLVVLCNEIALNAGFESLHFTQGTIEAYDAADTNILIALHACDTATDDAIAKGITADAELIVVAPCCHKQIRREMEKHKTNNDVDFLTRHGVFMERQAEMVTDGIRAMILEYFGYKTKVFEFISDAHTPKNVMIAGVRQRNNENNNTPILERIKAAKNYFGIEYHHLEKILRI
ncbi:hypothetical protein DYBT9275_05581 [Dyadobacter sp. CECT 9275]|uniref:Methyltransferase domain-containing protein n=1 Tax=Dyadobacter helix TaxID=2822344 RepID=A0A916JHR0_9BACT|nr:SAM-dependent methyltransferase [Dyadobacter sp. CECT 9275]CAG5016562.1 hypothetical protein DYBT9275_05581 [Dyadobacter sp. CECT 9275]